MTTDSWTRETLLKAVIACWPDTMPVKAWSGHGWGNLATWGVDGDRCIHLFLDNDLRSAEFMILILDEMERRGHKVELRGSAGHYDCNVHLTWEPKGSWRYWEGPTRAWAVAAAFVAVMRREPSPQPSELTEEERL